jgi:membrane associated rhomboid family serine protease
MSRNPILNWYDEWSNKTYFITRITMITLVTSYLLSCFLDTDKFLKNSVYFTVIHYEVYRLIASPFCSNSNLNVILSALFFLKMGITFESNLGSAAFFSMLGTFNLLVNLIFIAVCLLLYYICHMPEAIHFSCAGFWNILFAFLTVECFENPNHPRRFFMIPVDIPSKYFPLLVYAIWSLFSGPRLDWAISIAVGFMYQNGYFNCMKPNPQSLQNLESPTGMLHSISRSKGWILANVTIGHNEANRTGTEGGGSGNGLFWASQGGRGASGTGEDGAHAGPVKS